MAKKPKPKCTWRGCTRNAKYKVARRNVCRSCGKTLVFNACVDAEYAGDIPLVRTL